MIIAITIWCIVVIQALLIYKQICTAREGDIDKAEKIMYCVMFLGIIAVGLFVSQFVYR